MTTWNTYSTTIFQLQTDHCRLHAHLCHLGLSHTINCSSETGPQTSEHVLHFCPLYKQEQNTEQPLFQCIRQSLQGSSSHYQPKIKKVLLQTAMESIFQGLQNQNEWADIPGTYFLSRMNHKMPSSFFFQATKLLTFESVHILNFRKSLICTMEKGEILRVTPLKRPYMKNCDR